MCYGSVTSSGCTKPYGGRYKKVDCCCSVVGGGWGNPCQECPLENTGNTKRNFFSVFSHSFPSNFSVRAGSRLAHRNRTPTICRISSLADSVFARRACDSKVSLLADYSNLQFMLFFLNFSTLDSLLGREIMGNWEFKIALPVGVCREAQLLSRANTVILKAGDSRLIAA